MDNKKPAGEIAIITSSDSGISQATVIALIREGVTVAVTYLKERHILIKQATEPKEIARVAIYLAP